MQRKLFKSFIFTALLLVCSGAFAYHDYTRADTENDGGDNASSKYFIYIYAAAAAAAFWSIFVLNKEEKGFGGQEALGTRTGYIQDNTKEIISAMYDENLGFDNDDFQEHAKEVFKTLKTAYSMRDIDKLPFMSTDEYRQHRLGINKSIEEKEINITEIENFDKIYLYKYNKTAEYDYLAVFMEVFGAEYIIDDKTRELIPCGSDENQLLRYLLTFRRDRKVLEATVVDTPQSIACPKCGAPAVLTNFGKCTYCGAVIKDGSYAWALDGFDIVDPDNIYGLGGVFINDVKTERYKNGID